MLVDYSSSSSDDCISDDGTGENGGQNLERGAAVSGPGPDSINSPAYSCRMVSKEKKNPCKAKLGVVKIPTAAELFGDDGTVRPGGNKEGGVHLGGMKRKLQQPPPPMQQRGAQKTKAKGNGCALLIPQHVARSVSNTVTEDTSSFSDTAQHRRRKYEMRQ